jgi:hypothetical protein
MNKQPNIRDELLRADGIDPAGVSSSELEWFRGALAQRPAARSFRSRVVTWRVGRLAAAAAVLVLAAVGVYFFAGGTSRVWAKVLDNVRKTDNYRYHEINESMEVTTAGKERVYRGGGITYVSNEEGMVQERYSEGEQVARAYLLLNRQEMVTIGYADKEFRRRRWRPDREFFRNGDPRQVVIRVLEGEYTELGRKTVDGRVLAGIESHDQSVLFGRHARYVRRYDAFAVRFWIDMETKLPVSMEIEQGHSPGGRMVKRKSVSDQFQWNLEFPADFFTPQIPDGFTVWTDRPDETACINSLRLLPEFVGGMYPRQLKLEVFLDEMGDRERPLPGFKARQMASGEYRNDSILDAFSFYERLLEQGHDVAYYGDRVTPADADSVLMHWDLSETERRVIWGDLRIETLSVAQLEEALAEIWQRQQRNPEAATTPLVRGRLVYANGRPVNQGAVYLERAVRRTDENGYFALAAPAGEAGEYHLGHAHGPGRQTVGVFFWSLAQSVKRLDVVLDFPCTVRVRVVDTSGTLLRDATIRLISHPPEVADDFWVLPNRAQIDTEGYFIFRDVPVGLPLELFVLTSIVPGTEIRISIGEVTGDRTYDLADVVVDTASKGNLEREQ